MENKMNENMKIIFEKLNYKILDLHLEWSNFKEIYAKDEEQIKFLNKIANTFFYIVQNACWNNIVLDISKLTDPAETTYSSNKNLTLGTLLSYIKGTEHEKLYEEASSKLQELKNACKEIRTERNKVIAHNDFNILSKKESVEINRASREMIENALKTMREFMNLFNSYFHMGNEGIYESIISIGSGKDLIKKLRN